MSWASEFPNELLQRPTGLVVLTGLDTTYNAVHKAIWDAFCNNRRPDRVPLQFKVLGVDHEYPKCKTKRSSYEWFVPKGIVKSGWMRKQLEEVPAVVVVFFDLDWVETMWKERQMECATKVQIVRDSLTGRGSRVCVVLIQKNTPLPPGEDVVAAERASSLCSACELSSKSLFVLPLTDHLLGYTIRLENAFYELTQSYYHTEARRVKAHKEFLNKTTHQLLFVRHQFKIGFFNELKQDSPTALKYYKQAYVHLLELRMHDTNLLEIKTVAGYINYKICRLSFQHNSPLDAIGQFRKHIDYFKHKVGNSELAFEHSAWMSKQFHVFADLFDEAIKLGLTAIQTQHPGFYYQQAASHTTMRKEIAANLTKVKSAPVNADILDSLSCLDYYGQRPWRQGQQSIDPPDAAKEKEGILALQQMELKVDHSWVIIPLLSSAVAQFKRYKSPRMKNYLMVLMGTETCEAHNYQKALMLLSRVTWEYREERWWALLTSVLTTSLKCAYLTASVKEYISNSMELMGHYAVCSEETKTRIQMNLIRIVSGSSPEPEPGCSESDSAQAHEAWLKTQPVSLTFQMNTIVAFVECKACFTRDSFTADSLVSLKVFLRTRCPFPIRFSKLSVLFTNQHYNTQCVVNGVEGSGGDEGGDLYLVPSHPQLHSFNLVPHHTDIGHTIAISGIVLELGTEGGMCAMLHWPQGGGDAVPQMIPHGTPHSSKDTQHGPTTPWAAIQVRAETRITNREACIGVSLNHDPPCLLHEIYPLSVVITNNEQTNISDIKLSVGLKSGQPVVMEQTTHVSEEVGEQDGEVVCRRQDIALGGLEASHSLTKIIYIRCLEIGDREMSLQVSYTVEQEVRGQSLCCVCTTRQCLALSTIRPFTTQASLHSMLFAPVDRVHCEEAFLLQLDTSCSSPWPLIIEDSSLNLSSHVSFTDEEVKSQLTGVRVGDGERVSEVVSLVIPPSVETTVPLGTHILKWKRASQSDIPAVTTVSPLPSTTVEQTPVMIELELPSCGHVREVLRAEYVLRNRTPYAQEVQFEMHTTDSFMFAGHKKVSLRLLPSSEQRVCYHLVPLMAGDLLLPSVDVKLTRYPNVLENLLPRMLPTHIFVMPSGEKISEKVETEEIGQSQPARA